MIKQRAFAAMCVIAIGVTGAAGAPGAQAQSAKWPERPVRVVVPFPAGGTSDVLARLFTPRLSEEYGQQFVVDNRPGAGSQVAAEAVAKSTPDGYTLLLPAFAHAVNPSLYANLPFDTEKDFVPVALLTTSANLFAVHP